MDLWGARPEDFARVKVKNAKHGLDNPNARYRKESSVEDVLASPVVSDPLRLLDICATSDGAAALIVASKSFAEKHLGSVEGRLDILTAESALLRREVGERFESLDRVVDGVGRATPAHHQDRCHHGRAGELCPLRRGDCRSQRRHPRPAVRQDAPRPVAGQHALPPPIAHGVRRGQPGDEF